MVRLMGLGRKRLRATEEFADPIFRATDDGALRRHHDRPLHQFRMLHQQVDDGGRRLVIGLVESELGEDRILPNEFGHRAIKLPDDLRQLLAGGLGLEVLDGVELDTPLLKNLQRVRRGVSMRVVEDRDGSHASIMADRRTRVRPTSGTDQPGGRIAAKTSTAPRRSSISGA